MRSLSLFYHTIVAQLVIVLCIVIKVLLIPFLIWRFLGSGPGAMIALDVATIVFGTAVALTMGMIGYWQAAHFRRERRFRESVCYILLIFAPLAVFLLYKWVYGAAWDTQLLLLLSGWASMFSHPMNLVGFYGQWVDGVALVAMAGCYLLGVFVYHDEHRYIQGRPLQPMRQRVKMK
jgi:hypothetical protein